MLQFFWFLAFESDLRQKKILFAKIFILQNSFACENLPFSMGLQWPLLMGSQCPIRFNHSKYFDYLNKMLELMLSIAVPLADMF